MWNSNFTDNQSLFTATACPAALGNDLNKTRLVTQVFFACGTGAFYFVVVALSICGVYFANFARLCTSRGIFFVFFVGALLASTNVFTYSDNMDVKLYFRCSVVFFVGIVYISLVAVGFFQLNEQDANEQALGRRQPFMGAVVGVVTFFLFAFELVFLVLAAKKWHQGSNGELRIQRGILIAVDKTFFLFQKPVQLAIYLWLQHTTPREELNAKFYFRIISFFNLIEWLDAQVNVDADLLLSGTHDKSYPGLTDVVTVVYKALIIDYRLLCCLLFLEHSLEIEDNQNQDGDDDPGNNGNMTDRDKLKQYCGCFAGAACLLAPLLCGLYFMHVRIGASVQLSAMIVQIAIVISGVVLLRMNNLEAGEGGHNMYEESSAVKIMVCCFGAVGFLSWMMHAVIAGYWAVTADDRPGPKGRSYMTWDSVKYGVRGLSTAFIMYLFTMVNAQAFPQQNPDVTSNLVIVPVIMLGISSTFIETLVDQYFGAVDSTIRCETKEQIVKILLEAGLPMYLGFLIHVFLHFFIIKSKLPRCLGRNRRDSDAEYQDAVDVL